jgi:hypothetical protein
MTTLYTRELPTMLRVVDVAAYLNVCMRVAYRLVKQPGFPLVVLTNKSWRIPRALLLDSRVLRDQQLNERRQQRFASLADVVHKLKESQVDREFLLGNAPMRTQPTA